jgi:hypothetical protein
VLRIAISGGCAAGLLLSPKLWLSARSFPLTPVWSAFVPFRAPWDFVVYVALLMLLALIAIMPRPRAFIGIFAMFAFVLVLQDQSRLQPWFYQYVLMLLAIGFAGDDASGRNTCRFIVLAVYVWSGLSKFNPAFANGTFTRAWPHYVAYTVPLLEYSVGIALLSNGFRKAALIAAAGMHAYILWTIGPFGENYNTVVWPWNVAMIAFLLILFRDTAAPRDIIWNKDFVYHKIVIVLVGIAPALSFVNLWDSYPSFALYSSNSNSAEIFVSDAAFAELPEAIQDYVYDASPDVNRLSITDWSFGELNVPPYPERRIFLNVEKEICDIVSPRSGIKLLTRLKFGFVDSNRSYTDYCYASTALTTSPPTSVNRKSRP